MPTRIHLVELAGLVLVLAGCAGDDGDPTQVGLTGTSGLPLMIDEPCGEVTTVMLFAGQHINVGTVTVANDGEQLCVTYATDGEWQIRETHLQIAPTLGEIPQTQSGNPQVGRFADSHSLDPDARSDQFCFSLADLGYTAGSSLLIAAHAAVVRIVDGAVVQQETAWGDGQQFPGNNWAEYLMHTVQDCSDGDEEGGEEGGGE